MKKKQQIFKDLKKLIEKDFGKKCKDYSPLCSGCIVWRLFEDLQLMLER